MQMSMGSHNKKNYNTGWCKKHHWSHLVKQKALQTPKIRNITLEKASNRRMIGSTHVPLPVMACYYIPI